MTSYTIGSYTYSPFSVGFETIFDRLGRIEKTTHTYPPHNIVKIDDETYQIELAVAGLKEEDIDVKVEDNVLSIVYDKSQKDEREYTHKGISTRKFRKEFTLSEYVVVDGASLESGILAITLRKVVPEEKKPRKISINSTKKEFLAE